MPRKADPNLENVIVTAATRLLDKHGIDAITMRDVAKAAGTTTPTLYERFVDRDALLVGVLDDAAYDMAGRMKGTRNLQSMCEAFLDYFIEYPNRLDLVHSVWPQTVSTERKRPTYDLAVERLKKQHGHSQKQAEEIAQALMAMLLGTALLMVGSGTKTKFSDDSRRRAIKTVKKLAEGF